jgi:hypothetical protein
VISGGERREVVGERRIKVFRTAKEAEDHLSPQIKGEKSKKRKIKRKSAEN